MSSTTIVTRPSHAYRRQTPTIWQAIGRSIWQSLIRHRIQQGRTMMNMLALAFAPASPLLLRWRQQWHNPPSQQGKLQRSAVEQAAAVRALADTYRRSDPSFATDLYAAADRHEAEAERACRAHVGR